MGGSAQTTSTVNYTYNAKNQLMRQAETMADGQQNVSDYTYDRNGNLLARLESRFSAQAGGEAGGHMDEMGKGDKAAETKTATYTYDPFNQLTGYKTMSGVNASYGYYAGGLRSNKTVNGVTTGYYYDGMNVVNEVTNGIVSTNLRGAGYISRKTGDNTPNYFLYNIHTDVTQLANENGTVVKNYDYDAWGTPTKDDGAQIDNPIRYAGEYFDDESGMIYLRARYYQPEVGRFVSEDPAKDGMNWYGYCSGNPVIRFDPSGLFEKDDYKLTPEHVAQIFLYTMMFKAGDYLDSESIKHVAANEAAWIRKTDSKTSYHFSLAYPTTAYKGEYNGFNAASALIAGAAQVQERLSGMSSQAIGDFLSSMLGNIPGAIVENAVVGAYSSKNPYTEYADFVDRLTYIKSLQEQNGGYIDVSVVANSNEGYLNIKYTDEYNGVYINDRFFENTYPLIIFSALPL